MTLPPDIRKVSDLRHEEIAALNFIRFPSDLFFRKHFNQGLRSHVLEVLTTESEKKERHGEIRDGVRHFPRATPLHILRIFRARFDALAPAMEEVGKIKVLERYLPRNSYAKSVEFIVSFSRRDRTDIGLCGLQEYVDGDILDPWNLRHTGRVHNAADFISGLKEMIAAEKLVPDLAGFGNLKIDSKRRIRLVDINNISTVRFTQEIPLDDNGYPACDKSIEVLYRLEKRFLSPLGPALEKDSLYAFFLDPHRLSAAAAIERAFYGRLAQKRCPAAPSLSVVKAPPFFNR